MGFKKQWDLTKGLLSINGAPVIGFADGDIITAAYDTDWHTKHMGADGDGRLSANPSRDGVITIRLTQGSLGNPILDAVVQLGEPAVINYVDYTQVATFVMGEDCVIQKYPDWSRAVEEGNVEWPFICTKMSVKHGTAIIVGD